MLNVTNPMNS